MKIITHFLEQEYLMLPETNQDNDERLRIEKLTMKNEGIMIYEGFEMDTWNTTLLFDVNGQKVNIIGESISIDLVLMHNALSNGPRQLILRHCPKIAEHHFGLGFTIEICPLCKTEAFAESIIGYAAAWGICDKCAKKCKHEYITGNIFSVTPEKGITIKNGKFCKKCGRAKTIDDNPFIAEIGDKRCLNQIKDFCG